MTRPNLRGKRDYERDLGKLGNWGGVGRGGILLMRAWRGHFPNSAVLLGNNTTRKTAAIKSLRAL